jgi:type VI secretion system protein
MPLFEKFEKLEKGEKRPGRGESSLVESVLDNLENVLNSKRDYSSPLPQFGVRALTEYVSRNDIALEVIREVREIIELYEPRIKLESIAVDDRERNPFRLSFTINCSLREGAQVLHLSVDTVFGTFDVERE